VRWARVGDGSLDYLKFLAEFRAIQTQIRHWVTIGLKASSSRTAETCCRLLAAEPDLRRFVLRDALIAYHTSQPTPSLLPAP
jgi:hypothetical protein